MEQNKKLFSTNMVILLIVALFVGGGLVYLATKDNTSSVRNMNEVGFDANLNETDGVNENNQISQDLSVVEKNVSDNEQVLNNTCERNTASYVKVLSPNGGEVYSVGDRIDVKWKSCNVNEYVFVYLHKDGAWENFFPLTNSSTPDDGAESFLIDQNIIPGYYQIRMGASPANISQDWSDSYFTIEAQNSSVFTKSQAEVLAYQKWSDCSQGDCSAVAVSVAKDNKGQYLVTAIFTELDDSVSQTKKVSVATLSNGVWVLGEPIITRICHRGNSDGTTGWTAGSCI